jgi:hypothetical protein
MPGAMDQPLRPDLGRILPVPALRARPPAAAQLERALVLDASHAAEDFLVDVHHRDERDADAPGFGIAQALAVAGRVAAWLQRDPEPARAVHGIGHERVRPHLGD